MAVLLILEIQVRFSIEAQTDMSCDCVCQSVSPPSQPENTSEFGYIFFRAGLCVSLAGEAAVSSLHRGEVNETSRVVGETEGGGHKYTHCQ